MWCVNEDGEAFCLDKAERITFSDDDDIKFKVKARWAKLKTSTKNSEIDWSKDIHELDRQLYKKYNLTIDEIIFIETHIADMD